MKKEKGLGIVVYIDLHVIRITLGWNVGEQTRAERSKYLFSRATLIIQFFQGFFSVSSMSYSLLSHSVWNPTLAYFLSAEIQWPFCGYHGYATTTENVCSTIGIWSEERCVRMYVHYYYESYLLWTMENTCKAYMFLFFLNT